MKNLILICCLLVATNCYSQTPIFEVSGNPIQFSNVVKVDSLLKKNKLYSAAIEWFATNYKNSKYVLQMQDQDAGLVIGKGAFEYRVGGSNFKTINYTIKISIKDSKIKYDINDFTSDLYGGIIKDGEVTKAPWIARSTIKNGYAKTQEAINENGKELSASIESYFKNLSLKNDW